VKAHPARQTTTFKGIEVPKNLPLSWREPVGRTGAQADSSAKEQLQAP
jgi:hypothetical protein